ncbi:hypothetical protein D3C81_1720000 [compost metagenome]
MIDQTRPTRHRHAHRQHVNHYQVSNTRSQRRIDFGVFVHIDRQIDGRQFGQRRLARAQGNQRSAALTHQVGGDQQILGTPGLRNTDRHIGRFQRHRRHRLHVRIGIRRCSQQQTEELVLRIRRHCTRGAEAIELDPLRLRHQCHRTLQLNRIELLANLHQGVQRGVEDLQAVVGDRVVFMDRELAEACTGREALR